MSFLASILETLSVSFHFLWTLLLSWLNIFIIPFKELNLLWIILPIWFAWFFSEFFQEKRKTSFGNAISNGIVPVWVAVDWARFLVSQLNGNVDLSVDILFKFGLCLFIFLYGIMVISMGIEGDEYTQYFGRIRVITYFLLMFTPIIYGVIPLDELTIIGIGLFFPIFYYLIELIDMYLPDPKAVKIDEGEIQINNSKKETKTNQDKIINNTPQNVK